MVKIPSFCSGKMFLPVSFLCFRGSDCLPQHATLKSLLSPDFKQWYKPTYAITDLFVCEWQPVDARQWLGFAKQIVQQFRRRFFFHLGRCNFNTTNVHRVCGQRYSHKLCRTCMKQLLINRWCFNFKIKTIFRKLYISGVLEWPGICICKPKPHNLYIHCNSDSIAIRKPSTRKYFIFMLLAEVKPWQEWKV